MIKKIRFSKLFISKFPRFDKEYLNLFGYLFTDKKDLDIQTKLRASVHADQYKDCFTIGVAFDIIMLFIILGLGIIGWWTLSLLLIPIFLYYVWYYIAYLRGHKNIKNTRMEKQAMWIASTWDKPCPEKNTYTSFGWLNQRFK